MKYPSKHLKSMVTLPTLKARKLFPRSKCWMLSHQMANIYFKQLSTDGLDTSCQISLSLPVATSIFWIWASVYQYHQFIFSLLSGIIRIVVTRWTNQLLLCKYLHETKSSWSFYICSIGLIYTCQKLKDLRSLKGKGSCNLIIFIGKNREQTIIFLYKFTLEFFLSIK